MTKLDFKSPLKNAYWEPPYSISDRVESLKAQTNDSVIQSRHTLFIHTNQIVANIKQLLF